MTCIRMGNAIVCVSPWGRLKLGNRYVWVDFHEYCGPSFYWDAAMTKVYDPVDESDPVWDQFVNWLDKYRAGKARRERVQAARAARAARHSLSQASHLAGGGS
jgi:hypothetical protein